LKSVITIAAGTLALSVATRAALAAPPEYNRGYNDCLAGRYDEGEAQYSHSYRQGCRAAQEEQGATSGRINGAPRLEFPTSTEWSPSRPWRDGVSWNRNVGTSAAGRAVAGIYFNPQTAECVQLTSVNNRVVDARDIGTDRRCR
jgi:hypothetical protein